MLATAVLALTASACGTSAASASKPAVIFAGEVPPSAAVVGAQGGLAAAEKATGTTVPLAKASPATALFTALGVFQSCLKGLNVTFIGVPSAADPNSPKDNPAYIKALTTCAAQSNIIQALNAEKTAQENLTPKQVKAENGVYLKWRTCMISRGWVVPMPKPDAQGALFSFSGGGPKMTPPKGQSGFSSPDIGACLTLAREGKT